MKSYARIVTAELKPTAIADGIRVLNEQVAPSLKKQHGFQSWELLVNHTSGQMASITHYSAEADAQTASTEGFTARVALLEPFLVGQPSQRVYEVDVPK